MGLCLLDRLRPADTAAFGRVFFLVVSSCPSACRLVRRRSILRNSPNRPSAMCWHRRVDRSRRAPPCRKAFATEYRAMTPPGSPPVGGLREPGGLGSPGRAFTCLRARASLVQPGSSASTSSGRWRPVRASAIRAGATMASLRTPMPTPSSMGKRLAVDPERRIIENHRSCVSQAAGPGCVFRFRDRYWKFIPHLIAQRLGKLTPAGGTASAGLLLEAVAARFTPSCRGLRPGCCGLGPECPGVLLWHASAPCLIRSG